MKKNSPNKNKFDELSKLWLNKAREDLQWAKASFEDKFFAGACFISQQVAEKALKAYLFSQKQKLIKTHILLYRNFNPKLKFLKIPNSKSQIPNNTKILMTEIPNV